MPRWNIVTKDMVHHVEVELRNEAVRTEAGAMRYYHGNIHMQTKMPSIGGMIKSSLTGERVFRPVYEGNGKLVMEPSFYEFYKLDLQNEVYVIDRGAYWASDVGIEVGMKMNRLATGFMSGEGFMQTAVKGSGTVIIRAPGPVQAIDLFNDRLVVDGAFAVARSGDLKFTIEQATRSIMGTMFSGEILVNVFEGTGRVYIAPIPNHTVLMQNIIQSSMMGLLAEIQKK